jgi:hypothetical protein
LVFAAALSAPAQAAPQTNHVNAYGSWKAVPGQLRSIADLPPGQLRRQIQSLSPRAQANALRWLQKVSLTGADLDQLRADIGGGIFVADTLLPAQSPVRISSTKGSVSAAWVPSDAFSLHSKPGAANVVFLDFDGHTFTNTAWGAGTFVAKAFSSDADRTTFSNTERGQIVEIWHRVAEDLSPFDIDVTTQEPATFTARTGRVLITEDTDVNGVAMPSQGAGGVAYVNVFGASNYASYYSPALVYANNLGPNGATYIAEASSHEFGHNLGLSHDGTLVGGASYYGGLGSGLVSWAPIMGNGYYNNVTEWSKGEYPDANQTQDDLAIIAGKLSYRADDHGDTIATGTALVADGTGLVDSSNPEIDPYNLLPQNKGIINSGTDVDVFTFVSGAGPLTLTVTPAWDAFYRATDRRAANLDVSIELRDNANNVVASNDPNNDTKASVSATVAAGTYHLLITGAGNAITPYSDYNSMGEYFINGNITSGTADTTAPNPNPMTWASVPAPTGTSTIAMTASTAVDETSTVQYRFNCTAGGAGCVASAWQASPSYTATGLAASTQYSFTVQARDFAGNTTAASGVASATTDTPPPPPPYVDYAASGETLVAGSVSGNYTSTATDNGAAEAITEVDSGGQPAKRYSTLEHRWTFNVASAGISTTLVANAWSSGSTDGDVFNVQYSTNGGTSWSAAFTVSSTSNANVQSFALPGAPSGSILVRVVDSNRTAGAREMNTFSVDQLYIQVANPSLDPPNGGPSGLSASAASSSTINLAWTDGASNESGYRVERSADGVNGWSVVATLPVNGNAYTDTGLAASTTYFYRVSAFNSNGNSPYATANATTQAAPPPPSINLTATGTRTKGVSSVALSWSGSASSDVYRNGVKVASSVAGSSYTDNLGKVTGTFTHKVCVAGSTTTCSNTTTTTF